MRKFLLGIIILSAIPVMGQGTVSLDSCRRMAIANNKEILQQQIKIEQAGYQRKQAEAAYLPSFDFEGGYIYNQKKLSLVDKDQLLPTKTFNPATGSYDFNLVKDPTTGLPVIHEGSVIPSQVALLPKSALTYDVHNVFAAAVTMTQPIYMGGKIRAMNNITHYAEELARNMHDTKVQDVVYSVDEAYWRVVSLVAKKKLVESYLKLVQNLDSDVEKMIKEGVATKANKLTVDVKVNEADMQITQVEDGLSLARMLLCQLCGLPMDEEVLLADEDKEQLSVATCDLSQPTDSTLSTRPEVRLLQNAVEMSQQATKLVRSAYLPHIALTAGYMLSNPNLYNGFQRNFSGAFNIGVMVQVPVWNWFEGKYKVNASKAATAMAQMDLSDTQEKIHLQVAQSRYKVKEAYKRLSMAEKNIKSAEENLRCAQVGFREGVMESTDVLAAQTAWQQAQSQKIDAEVDMKLSQVNLQKALGLLE